MRTNNKMIYLLLLCGTIVFGSCSKWLDVKPQTSVRSDDLLNSEAGFKEALIGVYIGLSDPSIYGRELSFGFADVIAQQYEVPSGGRYYNSQIYNYKAINTMPIKDNIWTVQYNIIVNINNILNNIDNKKSVMSPIMYNIIKGELLGLRAFLHLDLMRLYGYGDMENRPEVLNKLAIPYTMTCSKEYIPQKSYKETIALIENDLLEALKYLKYDPMYEDKQRPDDYYNLVNSDGFLNDRKDRFNYWAVEATLVRLYSWIGNDSEALKYAKDIIEGEAWGWVSEYSISNTDQDQKDMTFSSEHLFSLRVTGSYADVANGYFSITSSGSNLDNMLYKSNSKISDLYEISSGVGISDYRYLYQFNNSDDKCLSAKLVQREKANSYFTKRIPLIRIPEVFLVAIEVLVNSETPDLTKAVEYFNIYRKARGIRQLFDKESDAALLNGEIIKEMRKEFICEGQLFYFYKRRNFDLIPSTNIKMNDKNYVVPFPDDEITYGNRVQ